MSGDVRHFLPGDLGRLSSRIHDLPRWRVHDAAANLVSFFALILAGAALIWFGVHNFHAWLSQARRASLPSGRLTTWNDQAPALLPLLYAHPIDHHSDQENIPVF